MQFGSWIGVVETNSNGKLLENRENIESNKNLVVENKIENLFHSPTVNEVVFEKTLKSIFKEQWELKKAQKLTVLNMNLKS